MTDLISIHDNHLATMSSLEIADLVDKRHDNVMRKIRELAEKGIVRPLPQIEEKVLTGGRPSLAANLNKTETLNVVANLCPEFTARVINRWQELEQQQVFQLPTNLPDALRLAAEQCERADKLQLENQELAPKARALDVITHMPDHLSLREAAKILDRPIRRFIDWLKTIGWLTRHNEPYQHHINAGRMQSKIGKWDHPDRGVQHSVSARITAKGLAELQKLLEKDPDAPPEVMPTAMTKKARNDLLENVQNTLKGGA